MSDSDRRSGGSSGVDPRPEPAAVLEKVLELARELHPERSDLDRLGLDSDLERGWGFDSLARIELVGRLEDLVDGTVDEHRVMSAGTPRDLLAAIGGDAAVAPTRVLGRVEGRTVPVPGRMDSLLAVVEWHAEQHGDRRHLVFLPDESGPIELSYGELWRRSATVAAGIVDLGIEAGDRIGLMLPSGTDYFAAFLGIQMAGAVPVPLYPPVRPSQIEDHLRRQAGILSTAEVRHLVTFDRIVALAKLVSPMVGSLRRVVTVDDLARDRDPVDPVVPCGDDLAFLQFTSGSTGNPKGVVLTHHNLLGSLRAMGTALRIGPEDAVVSWLPLYHDMGLIGAWMGSLYFAMPLTLMSPLSFLARPSRWLRTIHEARGTISAAPNFAYELCLTKIDDEEIEGIDLGSWRLALNGAEPVSASTVRRFGERFSAFGFRSEAMTPVYGLAECSLGVTFPPPGRGPRIETVDRGVLQRRGLAVPVDPGHENATEIVGAGFPIPRHEVRIVDESGREVEEREVGRLEFRGAGATSGYFRDDEATRKLRDGDWLDSGDLAFVDGGEVFVTGRAKDIIIRAGRNISPTEVEKAVGEIPGVRKGCVAVFGSSDPETGTERIVIMAETRLEDEDSRATLRRSIADLALDFLGTPPDEVTLVPPRTVAKTSSGKIRRDASRQLWERGDLGGGRVAVWRQLVRLGIDSAGHAVGRWARSALDLASGFRLWAAVTLLGGPIWILVSLAPGRRTARHLARWAARTLAALGGTSIRVAGEENLPETGSPAIVVANHASYLDAFVLTAALPPRVAFVAKRELADSTFTGLPLRRLGTLFVERFDAARGVADSARIGEALGRGDTVVVFPEGTFRRGPGILPFRTGAFVAAVDHGAEVVPAVIRGTRAKLRAGTSLPRRGSVSVTVLPPMSPEGEGWEAALGLRTAARREILRVSGEPDIAEPTLPPGADGSRPKE